MKVTVEKTGQQQNLQFKGTARQLLDKLEIKHVGVIVAVDRKLVALDKDISDAQTVEILSVISGG